VPIQVPVMPQAYHGRPDQQRGELRVWLIGGLHIKKPDIKNF